MRKAVGAVLVTLAALVGVVVIPGSQRVEVLDRARDRIIALTNADRERFGMAPLRLNPHIAVHAGRHSDAMRDAGELFHSTPAQLRRYLVGYTWSLIGENIGEAYSLSSLERAFMASPGHRENILNPVFRRIGVGVVEGEGGVLWVTVVFYG